MKDNKSKFDNFCSMEGGIKKILGFLEADIMNVIWKEKNSISVREVFEILNNTRDIAYTTVMTTMDRLYKKGLLCRNKALKGYIYWSPMTREDFEKHIVRETLKGLFSDLKEPLMSYFAHPDGPEDFKVIEEFSFMVENLKKEQEEHDKHN